MAYDPQAKRKRPRPTTDDTAPVEALLPNIPPAPPSATVEDPPPEPTVTPNPADPPSDQLLINSGLAAAFAGLAALLALGYLWRHRTGRGSAPRPP